MKNFSAAAKAEIEKGTAIVSGAVETGCEPPVRVWGGMGTIELDSEAYTGIADRGLVSTTGAALGGAEQGLSLILSGIEAKAIELVDAGALAGAPVTASRLIFDGAGKTLLDAHVFSRGRVDGVPVEETIGGAASIGLKVEGAARGLGRRGGRSRADADQRLVKANDGFYRGVGYAAERQLYWGGRKPATAAAALPGAVPPFGGGAGGREPRLARRS